MDNQGTPNLKDLIKKAVDEQVMKSLQEKQKTDRQVSFQLVEDKAPVEIVKDEVIKLQQVIEDKVEDLIAINTVGFKKLENKASEKLTPTIQALNNNLVSSLTDLKKSVAEVERATKANKPLLETADDYSPITNAVKSLEKAVKAIKLDLPREATDPLSVRLSNGEEFVNQLTQVIKQTSGVGGGVTVPRTVVASGSEAVPTVSVPNSSDGLDIFRTLDIDEAKQSVSPSKAQIYGLWFTNTATTTRWLKFYDAPLSSVTVGSTTPKLTVGLPGNASDDISGLFNGSNGLSFTSAITIACTTGLADSDTGAPGANDVVLNLFYKK